MKQTIICCLMALTALMSSGQNPIKRVLYTCGGNEDFYCYEFYSNMKTSGTKFACVTKNRQNSKLSFILNGQPVVTANNLEIFWIDVDSKEKCIYMYSDGDKEDYLVIDGHKYGPYEHIGYWQHACSFHWDGTPNLDLLLNRNAFTFKRMGKLFRHDNDGSIYECEGEDVWRPREEKPVYKSPNGQHKAQFSMEYRLLTVDGKSYVMPIDLDAAPKSIRLRNFYITDDGVCVVRFEYNNGTKWVYPYLVIKDNEIETINEGEYFDPWTNTIRMKGGDMPARRPRQLDSMMKWKDGSWINGIDISLQDDSNRHFFTANWNYDYVMIDDKKFGKSAPIKAFYDPTSNAFGWVAIEGRSLVLYTYKL